MKEKSILATFETHGVEFTRRVGNQAIGWCPFSQREDKLYVNVNSGLWDSKTAKLEGNVQDFLTHTADRYAEALKESVRMQKRLTQDRQLPWSALRDCGIGWDAEGKWCTIPFRGSQGKVVDIRRWRVGQKRVLSTPGCSASLWGAHRVGLGRIWLCEGEWDGVAMRWLLSKVGIDGLVVAVPGAGVFKREWIPFFVGRKVVVLYDHDEAGEDGELKVQERIGGVVREMEFIQWPENLPSGFDLRDWVIYGAVKRKTYKECFGGLQKLLISTPRQRQAAEGEGQQKRKQPKKVNWQKVCSIYCKWLHMTDVEPIRVLFGCMLANLVMEGDPVWLFLVAPPGGMKSELLMSLSRCEAAYTLTSLTPHTLVSGASLQGGVDPSLIPQLDGKVLVVKDFTVTLSMQPNSRDEIFGQLRDAYDGKYEKQFGTGIVRRYESTFGLLAGTTPNIDAFASLHSGLGERFLKYRMERFLEPEAEVERIERAMSNVNREVRMRDELKDAATGFLEGRKKWRLAKLGKDARRKIVKLSMLTARMRGVVHRDRFRPEMVVAKGSYEIGTRLAKQLSKMAIGLAMVEGKEEAGEQEYRLVKAIALGSSSDKIAEIVRTLYGAGWMRTAELSAKVTTLSLSTVFRVVQDLRMLGLVEKSQGKKAEWRLTRKMEMLCRESEVFEGRRVVRVKRK